MQASMRAQSTPSSMVPSIDSMSLATRSASSPWLVPRPFRMPTQMSRLGRRPDLDISSMTFQVVPSWPFAMLLSTSLPSRHLAFPSQALITQRAASRWYLGLRLLRSARRRGMCCGSWVPVPSICSKRSWRLLFSAASARILLALESARTLTLVRYFSYRPRTAWSTLEPCRGPSAPSITTMAASSVEGSAGSFSRTAPASLASFSLVARLAAAASNSSVARPRAVASSKTLTAPSRVGAARRSAQYEVTVSSTLSERARACTLRIVDKSPQC
mmetsp:Transcript_10637/g.28417  ORF Transcript_10637/g.28417 Transcript_10637/m.28417 type:complete len:273 (+) Transcript_10637:1497-2315(+)